jgi:hypothetical protein
MPNKRNLVLYVDSELVKKTREYGFNLSKIFENHMKTLIKLLENCYSGKNGGNTNISGSPGEITLWSFIYFFKFS